MEPDYTLFQRAEVRSKPQALLVLCFCHVLDREHVENMRVARSRDGNFPHRAENRETNPDTPFYSPSASVEAALVGMEGVEPSPLSGTGFESVASAIPPHTHVVDRLSDLSSCPSAESRYWIAFPQSLRKFSTRQGVIDGER